MLRDSFIVHRPHESVEDHRKSAYLASLWHNNTKWCGTDAQTTDKSGHVGAGTVPNSTMWLQPCRRSKYFDHLV